jgi:hypothetical protein
MNSGSISSSANVTISELQSVFSSPVSQAANSVYSDYVMGAAIFDLNNLPIHYFTTGAVKQMEWVQATFQALCLQSFLGCCLQLTGFNHVKIHGKECTVILVRQKNRYVGLLLQKDAPDAVAESILQWAQVYDAGSLDA